MIQIGASAATIDSPIEHLVACHRRIEQRLDTLFNASGHLENDRRAALDAIGKSLQFLDTSGALHTEDEEASVFPRLRPKLTPAEIAFLDALEEQHEEAESIYAELKRLVGALDSSCAPDSVSRYRECAQRLRAHYRQHIQAEDENLINLAERFLSDADRMEISREMRVRRTP